VERDNFTFTLVRLSEVARSLFTQTAARLSLAVDICLAVVLKLLHWASMQGFASA
jgi:hypothetical protein